MTKPSGGTAIDRGSAPEPDREQAGDLAGSVREKGENPAPDDRERGETPDAEDCTAHDRAG
jgi:hypothetical protein